MVLPVYINMVGTLRAASAYYNCPSARGTSEAEGYSPQLPYFNTQLTSISSDNVTFVTI